MKHVLIGLLPVIVFWFFEDKFGTFWGLVAAIVWGVSECAFEYLKNKVIDRLTLISAFLVVALGGLSILLDQSLFFKFQPVITEMIFAGIMYWQIQSGGSFLFDLAKKSNPSFGSGEPHVVEAQKRLMMRMTKSMTWLLCVHALALSVIAFKGTTGQWAFVKGVGFYVFFLIWFAVEFVWMRWQARNRN